MNVKGQLGFHDIAIESLNGSLGQTKRGHEDDLDLDIVHARECFQERSPTLSQLTGWVQHSSKVEKRLMVPCLECGVNDETTVVFKDQTNRK